MNSWARIVGIQLMLAFVLAGASVINRGSVEINKLIEKSSEGTSSEEIITLTKSNKSKKFEITITTMTWSDAMLFCKERHGNLATIESQDDVNLAKQMGTLMYNLPASSFWVGGTNTGSTRGFYWIINGLPISSYWSVGNPDGPTSARACVRVGHTTADGDWGLMNFDCSWKAFPVCEYY